MSDISTHHQAGRPSGGLRILVLGKNGQLGRELARAFAKAGEIIPVDRSALDLTNFDQIRSVIRDSAPDLVLNAAAYTAVDRAEFEHDQALAINAQAPRVLAEEARRRNALFVHYSTDYVFDGKKSDPWTESDKTYPLNVYGASKLAGEQGVQEAGGNYLIFRTSWVYGPHGSNFLFTMLRLGRERESLSIVDDQIGAPTTSIELARATHAIVSGLIAGRYASPQSCYGLYHMSCSGSTSWFGFAQAIFARATQLLGVKPPELKPIASSDYKTHATRPQNSVLSNEKLHTRFGIQLQPWESALDEVMQVLRSESPQQ